jgi:protein-tyrosine-phosphatase
MPRERNILVLCQANSARSIMAEALIGYVGQGRFRGYSAGSQPKSQPHPLALAVLAAHGHDIDHLRSKSWDVFTENGGPAIDIVITVCDEAAGEACPYFPGRPTAIHWGMPDPAAARSEGEGDRVAFERAYDLLLRRLRRLAGMPEEALEAPTIATRLAEIAEIEREGPLY